jgi:alpha-galactosidase
MTIISQPRGWIIETKHTAYAIGINEREQLVNRYWGTKLPHPNDYPLAPDYGEYASFNGAGQRNPEEYPAYGGGLKYIEPCLKAIFADGVRDVWLTFKRHIVVPDENVLSLVMEDEHYPLRVYVVYRYHPETDMIERYVDIQNKGNEAITLERALSAAWHLPISEQYELMHFSGKWNDEFVLHREKLPKGIFKIDSKRGFSSHHHNPAFLITRPTTTETYGDCWFGALEYTGNWQLISEVTDFGTTRFSMGLNDWDFAYRLNAGASLLSPSVFLGYSENGLSSASHTMHEFIRARLPHPDTMRKVLFNSWEVTLFDAEEQSQKHYADIAASLGVELFVMDDGWFKGRNSDTAGLGDWTPDPIKFPNGIGGLVQHVNDLDMSFGLWLEPEMVNPDSDLYRAHPEWVIHFPNRERTTARNQLVLNLARTDVQEYIISCIDKLLSEHNIEFIKWDVNRNLSEAGWQTDKHDPKEIWVRYIEGLYHILTTMRERYPYVVWQSCSGGGGRSDLGMLHYADQVWISDNTEPTRRIPMQRNFSHIYPSTVMEAWVTDMGASYIPLKFRFHVSMCGLLGIGAHIANWTPEERELAKEMIAEYKEIRSIIQFGTLHRLDEAYQGVYSATQYMNKDQNTGVLFVFRTYLPQPTLPYVFRLRGLNHHKRYRVEGLGSKTGAGWMYTDIHMELGNFESRLIHIQEEVDHV